MNYRRHFQESIIQLQRSLDKAMLNGDWHTYHNLKEQIVSIKNHIIVHESMCGYECSCEPDSEFKSLSIPLRG